MAIQNPEFLKTLIISDDAKLAATASTYFARKGQYLAVIDGPRMGRPDKDAEVIRRNNTAALIDADQIIMAGVKEEAIQAFTKYFPSPKVFFISCEKDLVSVPVGTASQHSDPLQWGNNYLGVGLLKALRERRGITFSNMESPASAVDSESGHLVVCEAGEDLSEIIAANYSFALGAGLHIIPKISGSVVQDIMERFYSINDDQSRSQTELLSELRDELRGFCGALDIPPGGSITFITKDLPFGFAFSEVPTTHLFVYPDLGLAIVRGFAAEQPNLGGIGVALLIDPSTVDAPEIESVKNSLLEKKALVRSVKGSNAHVREASLLIELFPFDLLVIATHCGDIPGRRWTCEFKDSEGIDRKLVVDVAIGVGREDEDGLLEVTEMHRIVSLDGVPWDDEEKKNQLYTGTAIRDFTQRTRGRRREIEPVKTDDAPRVQGTAALKMYDNNLILMNQNVGGKGLPIIINNACVSWHELAGRFLFAGARGYVGTLIDALTSDAHAIATELFGKQFGKPLPIALWAAQNRCYGVSPRRPYIVTGVFTLKLRRKKRFKLPNVLKELIEGRMDWQQRSKIITEDQVYQKKMKEFVDFYDREIDSFRRHFLRK